MGYHDYLAMALGIGGSISRDTWDAHWGHIRSDGPSSQKKNQEAFRNQELATKLGRGANYAQSVTKGLWNQVITSRQQPQARVLVGSCGKTAACNINDP